MSIKIFSKPVQEEAFLLTLFLGVAYFAGSKRMITIFNGANRNGLLLSGAISTASALAIEHRRFQNNSTHGLCNLIFKCWAISTIALFLPLPVKLLGNRVSLSLKSSLKLGALNICNLVFTHFLFSIGESDETLPIWNEEHCNYELDDHPFQIRIEVDRKDLKANPRKHLKNLATALQLAHEKTLNARKRNPFITLKNSYPQFKVGFVNEDVIDIGGGSREYLDDLFKALSEDPLFQTSQDNPLALPQPAEDLSLEDQVLFEHLGQVLMTIHQIPITEYSFSLMNLLSGLHNTNYYIGQHFDSALFKGALALTAREIDTPYADLSIDLKLHLAQTLLQEDEHATTYKNMIGWIQQFDFLSPKEIQNIDDTLQALGYTCTPENRLQTLQEAFFSSPKGDSFLASIHNIAKGMKSLCLPPDEEKAVNHYWDMFAMQTTPLDFSTKVQGSLDRKEIASRFILDESLQGLPKAHIEERVNWMKEWIEQEATEMELRELLKFQTGSSSCPPKGVFITVHAQGIIDLLMGQEEFVPIPNVSTCEFMMRLSPQQCGDEEYNDWTKENFIKCLKAAISGENPFSCA